MRSCLTVRRLLVGGVAALSVLAAPAAAAPAQAAPARPAGLFVGLGSFAAAFAASTLNPAASPPGVNTGCLPSAAHPYPVVLVNGTFTTMQSSFDYLGPTLANAGYCVFGYNYGGDPRSPVQATGPVNDGVTALANEVQLVRQRTGAAKVNLVGYSQGGLISEIYTKFGGAGNVHSVTAIAPTTHGTTLLGLGTLATQVPGALTLLSAGCPACSDQVVGSAVVTRLDTGPIAVAGIPYTVVDTIYEDVVTPTGSSFIREPGVVNQYVQGVAPFDVEDHISLVYDPVNAALVLAGLRR